MEPANIDWKKIESRFERDDLFEHFNAPKWVDLSSPIHFAPGEDEAFFCRSDCKHPKTHEDFLENKGRKVLRSMSSSEVIGDRDASATVKRRGGAQLPMTPLLGSPRAKPVTMKKKKKGVEERGDLENQNPNLPPPLSSEKAKMVSKIAKEVVKSSAEKPVRETVVVEEVIESRRRLKSTYSARNLFAGKQILAQISEFCGEIRRMATARRGRGDRGEYGKIEKAKNAIGEESEEEKQEGGGGVVMEKSQFRNGENRLEDIKKSTGECLKLLQQEVRSCPPTPQRFPSPMSSVYKKGREGASPLKPSRAAPPKERGVLKEMVLKKDDDDEIEEERGGCVTNTSSNNVPADEAVEPKALDMFWFLKPCTYLV